MEQGRLGQNLSGEHMKGLMTFCGAYMLDSLRHLSTAACQGRLFYLKVTSNSILRFLWLPVSQIQFLLILYCKTLVNSSGLVALATLIFSFEKNGREGALRNVSLCPIACSCLTGFLPAAWPEAVFSLKYV